MQCFVCGEPMQVAMVEPHPLIDLPGFELRTFQCEGCGDVEKRLFFDSEHSRRVPALVSETEAAPERSASTDSSGESSESIEPPGGLKKSIFGGLARLRGAWSEDGRPTADDE
jgi:uncharacterized Zn finger protein